MSTPSFPTRHQLSTQAMAAAMMDEGRAQAGQSAYWCARDAWMVAALHAPDPALHRYALDRAWDCAVANGDPVETMRARFPDRY